MTATLRESANPYAAATSEKVQEVQNGTAKKLGEFIQALFTGFGGLAVGFYFSWKLSLVIMAGVPLLGGDAVQVQGS